MVGKIWDSAFTEAEWSPRLAVGCRDLLEERPVALLRRGFLVGLKSTPADANIFRCILIVLTLSLIRPKEFS